MARKQINLLNLRPESYSSMAPKNLGIWSLQERIEWDYIPAKADRKRYKAALFFVIFLPLCWLVGGGALWESLISALLLLLALGPAIFRQNYLLEKGQIRISGLFIANKRLKLMTIKRVRLDKSGLLLSPYKRPSRLDSFHGLYLRGNQDVLEAVALKIKSLEQDA